MNKEAKISFFNALDNIISNNINYNSTIHLDLGFKANKYIEETKINFFTLSDTKSEQYVKSEIKQILESFDSLKELNEKYGILKTIDEFQLIIYSVEQQLTELFEINNKGKELKDKYPTNKYWFITGLEFAKGNISLEITDHLNTNYRRLAISLGNENYRNYIEGTIKNFTENNTDKNLFLSKEKPQLLINYCKKENIEVCQAFVDKFNSIKPT